MESLPAAPVHPCVKCGACCATYKVLFEPAELSADSYHVPKDVTAKVDANTLVILGTIGPRPRCIALEGHIGKRVGCTIYDRRPGCCRDFKPAFETGLPNPRCDEARRGKALKPLRPADWAAFKRASTNPVD